jgi:hypothetical protein
MAQIRYNELVGTSCSQSEAPVLTETRSVIHMAAPGSNISVPYGILGALGCAILTGLGCALGTELGDRLGNAFYSFFESLGIVGACSGLFYSHGTVIVSVPLASVLSRNEISTAAVSRSCISLSAPTVPRFFATSAARSLVRLRQCPGAEP